MSERSYTICKEVRRVSNGYVVVLSEVWGTSEHICATWEDVLDALSRKAGQPPIIRASQNKPPSDIKQAVALAGV